MTCLRLLHSKGYIKIPEKKRGIQASCPLYARRTGTNSRIGVADHYVLGLVNVRLRHTLKIESINDLLTNLYNRRYMEESLERELSRAVRYQTHVRIIMVDIDHFKHFNDTYGHGVGDQRLQAVGAYLKGLRILYAAMSGEEMLFILPDIELDDLEVRANSARVGVKNHVEIFYGEKILSVTISLRVASFPDHDKISMRC